MTELKAGLTPEVNVMVLQLLSSDVITNLEAREMTIEETTVPQPTEGSEA